MLNMLKDLWSFIPKNGQKKFLILLLLMIFVSLVEVISIGSIIPFLSVITDPNILNRHPNLIAYLNKIGVKEGAGLLMPLLVAFFMATILACFSRIFFLAYSNKLSFKTGSDLGFEIYRRVLYQSYLTHVSTNTSEIINSISNKTHAIIYGVIMPSVVLISSVIILLSVLFFLIIVDPIVSITALCGFGLIYSVVAKLTAGRKRENSVIIAEKSTQVIKCLQEGLGSIRDIIIDRSQDIYCAAYAEVENGLRKAQYKNQLLIQSPRYIIESAGMLLIATLAYVITVQPGRYTNPILVLGVLAIAAQRMLPILQQAYASISLLQSTHASLKDVLKFLNQPAPGPSFVKSKDKMVFKDEINLCNVSFKYSKELKPILKDLNLKIQKGDRIGFIGPTGCGKSTLMDVIMGLLEPTSGFISVDGNLITGGSQYLWYPCISHVPQGVYLSDGTVEENIAFGLPKSMIDRERVVESARAACISEAIESWPLGYQTIVGERGVKLSGGQRQRIGLARALYKRSELIVLDEATSALDEETEKKVMRGIDSLSPDLTILIVAHRLSTLKNCNKIVKMGSGKIESITDYIDII